MGDQQTKSPTLCGSPGPASVGLEVLGCIMPLGHGGLCQYDPDAVVRILRPTKTRANWLPAPHYFNLNHACRLVNDALGGFGCYLVGSSLERRDFRDVDVRFILGDAEYDRLFPKHGDSGCHNAMWSLLCSSISEWLSRMSGLPVDFQIQRQTQANEKHKGVRSALGIVFDYPGERPSDINVPTEKNDGVGQ